jgi:hypothetical protein
LLRLRGLAPAVVEVERLLREKSCLVVDARYNLFAKLAPMTWFRTRFNDVRFCPEFIHASIYRTPDIV